MYDILQLNDMLVPELLDIAEQLSIANAKKLDKQELIYKILDKQAIENSAEAKGTEEKGKRKRVVKTTTANSTEEALVESEPEKATSPGRKRKIVNRKPLLLLLPVKQKSRKNRKKTNWLKRKPPSPKQRLRKNRSPNAGNILTAANRTLTLSLTA